MENKPAEENKKCFIIAFSYGWYFKDFETMSTEKIPNAVLTSGINEAKRFLDREEAKKIAKYYYGGYVIERQAGLQDYIEQ